MIGQSAPIRAPRPARPRRLARNLLGLTVLATALVALAAPTATLAWTVSTFSSASESLLVQLHNQARANAGLPALSVDSTLQTEARSRSKDMGDKGYFSHSIPPDGHSVFVELRNMGYCYSVAGENIGWNTYPDGPDTQAMFDSFMASSVHKNNILGTSWTKIGIGAYQAADKKIWTVLFSLPCGTATPPPVATPKPTPTPTPRSTPGPATPRPTSAPTDTPPPVEEPSPTPTPTPTPIPTLPPDLEPPDTLFTPSSLLPSSSPRPSPAPSASTAPVVRETADPRMRIVDSPALQGLFETIVGGVTGVFFGS